MKRVIHTLVLLSLTGRLFASVPTGIERGIGQVGPAGDPIRQTDFSYGTFDRLADFRHAAFDTAADFARASFGGADFFAARFNGFAYFWRAAFAGSASFSRAQFDSAAYFVGCAFRGGADFGQASFNSAADFRGVLFGGDADFSQATFHDTMDLRGATFAAAAHFADAVFQHDRANFTFTVIKDDLIIGSSSRAVQTYNFKDAVFSPKGRIVIVNRVKLHIPLEKMKFVTIADHLDYYSKKSLIEFIKDASFKADGNKFARERLELDYIYAKSTMYQDKVFGESENRLYQLWKWPRWGSNLLYDLTMGLGFRPFRLVFWLLGVILFYAILYSLTMADDVATFIRQQARGEDQPSARGEDLASPVATLINCLHFSASAVLTCRRHKYILTCFPEREKIVIFSEWLFGLIILISFITLSKPGAIPNAFSGLLFR
ncbi:pentapeptide repeat-containing protein [candidate division KSB1 bacterium]|nr:pentapeptide repeat-containing protein [candidate division KSB1 bacterium]RQW06503.1 MAG: hypothetical protein EH222_08615 [candidate division KSB1 bacterium]